VHLFPVLDELLIGFAMFAIFNRAVAENAFRMVAMMA